MGAEVGAGGALRTGGAGGEVGAGGAAISASGPFCVNWANDGSGVVDDVASDKSAAAESNVENRLIDESLPLVLVRTIDAVYEWVRLDVELALEHALLVSCVVSSPGRLGS